MKKFENYKNNLRVLATAGEQDLNNEFIVGGIIDKFYIQFEMGWKVLKELLAYEGIAAAKNGSPREIIKEAYRFYTCIDEDVWLDMLAQRNNSAHIYNVSIARELTNKIILNFVPAFQALESSIESRYKDILDTL